jgi:hypothetical protein
MQPNTDRLSVEILRQCFRYDHDTGNLFWLERPREHFLEDMTHIMWNTSHAGWLVSSDITVATTLHGRTYRLTKSHIIWALITGSWPKQLIDHINGVGTDNRLVNLREATYAENSQNITRFTRNTSGYVGVYKHKTKSVWFAQIGIKGRKYCVGRFNTPEEAHEAYLKAKRRLHTFQPELNLKPK